MAGTQPSARSTGNDLGPANSDGTAAGSKRKPEAELSLKRSRKAPKTQATLEETGITKDESEEHAEAKIGDQNGRDDAKCDGGNKDKTSDVTAETDTSKHDAQAEADNTRWADTTSEDNPVEESSQRKKEMPSNILEKGLVYFFTRSRVGIDDADSVGDLQRTFFVLRPLPNGAKLGDGAIPDMKNNRLFALPKKTFPKSHNDRFMAFVEKANTTIQDLKDNFFKGSHYETKTQGTRRVDPVTPVAEGVYAITRTEDRTTHLVYSTTIPSDLGEIQEDLGIKDQGSFIISVKNPERSGPASASLPQKPEFSKEIIEEFRGLAWGEVKPKYLDHEYCQILLIGEHLEKGVEPTTKDKKHDKETPKGELEKLEHEDELRVEHLHGDDSVFDDLNISKKDYPRVPTTW